MTMSTALPAAVVFLANLALLVLQLVAPRYLAPAVGSSLETWTTTIGIFLTGIALGNWLGGRLADGGATPGTLGRLLTLGAVATGVFWGVGQWVAAGEWYRGVPMAGRVPLLTALLCLLPATALSAITPVAIRLALRRVDRAGRVAGLMFAVSTLGCLLGNYLTGFVLLATFTTDAITIGVAALLALTAVAAWTLGGRRDPALDAPLERAAAVAPAEGGGMSLRRAYLVVFGASFCGMTLELAGFRVLAPYLGVSLYTWTGIIGVMLAGTAAGNYLGGVLADRGLLAGAKLLGGLACAAAGVIVGPVLARGVAAPFGVGGFDVDVALDRTLGAGGTIGLFRVLGAGAGVGFWLFGLWLAVAPGGWYVWGALLGAFAAPLTVTPVLEYLAERGGWPALAGLGQLVTRLIGAGLGLLFIGAYHIKYILARPMLLQTPGEARRGVLSLCLIAAGLTTLGSILFAALFGRWSALWGLPLVERVLVWTFGLFFLPMLCLGTVSPQVIRLTVPDVARSGRTIGGIYAVSTAGAIAGTFAAGYVLISGLGTIVLLLALSTALTGLAALAGGLFRNVLTLFAAGLTAGALFTGAASVYSGRLAGENLELESDYYAIGVKEKEEGGVAYQELILDRLIHSTIKVGDPFYLYYKHEAIQVELARDAMTRRAGAVPKLLVIGGGGYTFPRYCEEAFGSRVTVDVVEIDPGVTRVAHERLGLPVETKIRTFNRDGRQFVAEVAEKGSYDLVFQDAVNDLSVPYHLMTKEYNDAVKGALRPGGAYLLTVIDSLNDGLLWRAAVHTLRQSFPHVTLLYTADEWDSPARGVYMIYAADVPFDLERFRASVVASKADLPPPARPLKPGEAAEAEPELWAHVIPADRLRELLDAKPALILSDRFAPVDNLMSGVFRERN